MPLPLAALEFRRPAGQRHVISGGGGDPLVLKVAGAELQLEGVDRDMLCRVLASPAFTLDDLATRFPAATDAERAELLDTLVRAGLLVARVRS